MRPWALRRESVLRFGDVGACTRGCKTRLKEPTPSDEFVWKASHVMNQATYYQSGILSSPPGKRIFADEDFTSKVP